MRYFSAFTGVGGFDLGMPPDWQCVGMSEVNKAANMVLKYRFKDVKNYGDVEKIKYDELPDFEVLIGGSPCQDVSVAGKREGLAGSRSRLFYSYVEILKVKQPDYFIFENVKGLLSSNDGWDFAEVANQFSQAGYDLIWQLLDAVDFGIPQHRERVFIFGSLRGKSTRKVFFERKNKGKNTSVQEQQANTLTRRYRQSECLGSYIIEGKFKEEIETLHPSTTEPYRIYGINGISPTLHRNTGGYQVPKIGIPVSDVGHTNARQNGRRIKDPNEPSFTLQSAQRQGVAIPVRDVNYGGEHAKGRRFKEDDEPAFTNRVSSRNGVFNGMDIRYLTPVECERLQGWPDNWTKYGINDKGEIIEMSDNSRYNLIGNGVVPQIVREIIKKEMV